MTQTPTAAIGDDIYVIDTHMGGHSGITSSYLIRSSRPCLVETGTARTAQSVASELNSLGVAAADLATIVVTHIHLDHAGAVGDLAEMFPNARIVVHENGARHLVDPARLMSSSTRVFGEPTMDRLFGELRPTAAERIVTIGEAGAIDLGDGRRLDAFHTPGHASHHICLVDSQTGDLYTGDSTGVYVPDTSEIRTPTPPPEFDLDVTLESLGLIRDIGPSRLMFSHFGLVDDVAATLDESVAELRYWVEQVAAVHVPGTPVVEHTIELVRERDRMRHPDFYADADLVTKYEDLASVATNVHGVARWLDRER